MNKEIDADWCKLRFHQISEYLWGINSDYAFYILLHGSNEGYEKTLREKRFEKLAKWYIQKAMEIKLTELGLPSFKPTS